MNNRFFKREPKNVISSFWIFNTVFTLILHLISGCSVSILSLYRSLGPHVVWMYITVIEREIPMVHLDVPRGRPVRLATPSLIYSRAPRWAECNIKALADDRTLQLHYAQANGMDFINMLRNALYLNVLQYLFQKATPFFSLFLSNCFGFEPKIIFSGGSEGQFSSWCATTTARLKSALCNHRAR